MRITPRKYAQALAQSIGEAKEAGPIIQNFLAMLRRRKQFRLLPKIVQAFEEEWNARNGLVKISVTYPKKFEGTVEDFEKSLSAKLGKKVVMSKTPSDSLIGGLRLHMGDTLIDASLEGQLKMLGQKLSQS